MRRTVHPPPVSRTLDDGEREDCQSADDLEEFSDGFKRSMRLGLEQRTPTWT